MQFCLLDSFDVIAYPINMDGYASICEVLTIGNMRAEKGSCHIYQKDLLEKLQAVQLILVPPQEYKALFQSEDTFISTIKSYKEKFDGFLSIAAHRKYNGDDHKTLYQLQQIAMMLQTPLVATNNVFYHKAGRRQLQDLLTCIKEKCTIQEAGFRLYPNAERYLKPAEEMVRLFRQYPNAIAQTQIIADSCQFNLDQLKYEYPEEITEGERSPQEELEALTWQGAKDFYGDTIPEKVIANIHHEFKFIKEMDYSPYFLTVYDIVKFARDRGILCQGRGSAANSTVCFCLGITSVNPAKFDLLFERFLSAARNEPPDIDVDFEHERREEVIQYIYEKYGRHRAAIVATVTQQHQKGAIRDIAKAMGLSLDVIHKIASSVLRSTDDGFDLDKLSEIGINIKDAHFKKVLALTNEYIGFPRQLGQHTGGFVISRKPLYHLCPVLNARMENRTCLEWNKDDIETLGFLKIDILGLGMLTCIRKAFTLVKERYNVDLTLANVPQDDPIVYDMICEADTIGVFQIESRAQQSMLPRLKPRCFYDLVIEVAIVRPGPIQGDMVHPYLRRRNGEEEVSYPSKELEDILSRTLGVPLFQEQAMKLAIVAASFTPTEADELRRGMATFKIKGKVSELEDKLVNGMLKNGYTPEYAQKVFRQLQGFGSYGFPESHAASFALLVYVSSWLKCHYPEVFACALLNSLPMGFYQPAQIVIDARKHEVDVRPVDINYSCWDNTLEDEDPDSSRTGKKSGKYFALRIGFRQVSGFRIADAETLIAARTKKFMHINQLSDAGLSTATLEQLADADAFRSLGLDRRQALWEVAARDKPIGMFKGQDNKDEKEKNIQLPFMQPGEHVLQDYASTSLSLKAHPLSFMREKLSLLRAITNEGMMRQKDKDIVKVAGLVLVRQRPGTAKGVWFVTLEDETDTANLVIFTNVYEQYKKEIIKARVLMVEGKLQMVGKVIHVIVQKCFDVSSILGQLTATAKISLPNLSRADEMSSGAVDNAAIKKGNAVIHAGRNFR